MQTRVSSATFGRTAAHVEVEFTPRPESRMTAGSPALVHSMNIPWPWTSKVPLGGFAGLVARGSAPPPQPARAAAAANVAGHARIRGRVCRRAGVCGNGAAYPGVRASRGSSPQLFGLRPSNCGLGARAAPLSPSVTAVRRRQGAVLGVGAERAPAGAGGAELAVRAPGDLVALVEHAAGERDDLLLEGARVGSREAADDGLARALEEAVGDVHARGAVAQRGERVDDALGRVVAVEHLGRVGAVEAVGLVVDDQAAAPRLGGDHVDEAVRERAAAARLEREREAGLAADGR